MNEIVAVWPSGMSAVCFRFVFGFPLQGTFNMWGLSICGRALARDLSREDRTLRRTCAGRYPCLDVSVWFPVAWELALTD